jgi:hypothetical protein
MNAFIPDVGHQCNIPWFARISSQSRLLAKALRRALSRYRQFLATNTVQPFVNLFATLAYPIRACPARSLEKFLSWAPVEAYEL